MTFFNFSVAHWSFEKYWYIIRGTDSIFYQKAECRHPVADPRDTL